MMGAGKSDVSGQVGRLETCRRVSAEVESEGNWKPKSFFLG